MIIENLGALVCSCDVNEELCMLMVELYQESLESSFRYRSSGDLKDVCMSIATRGRGTYLDESGEVIEDLVLDLMDMLDQESSNLRSVTGMDVSIRLDPEDRSRKGYSVHVDIPKRGKTPSAIYGAMSDSDIESILNGRVVDTTLGTLNYDTRKVTGYYSTIEFKINVGVGLFDESLLETPELAAVILHEIGHIWDFLEGLGEMNRSIAIASYTKKVLRGNYSFEKKLDIVEALGATVEDPTNVTDEEIYTLVAAQAFARKDEAGKIKTYELFSEEFLADDFATQYGMGYHLAKALRKLELNKFFLFRDGQYRPKWTGFLGFLDDAALAIEGGRYLAGLSVKNPIVFPILFGIGIASLPMNGKLRPRDRLYKVREGMISALRDPDTTATDRKNIVADLKLLDKEIKNLRDEPFSIVGWILKLVSTPFLSSNKRHYSTRMNLDSLDNNRLFEMAERLKSII